VSNRWRERRVVAFAHQGGSFEGPSSTLAAIEWAIAAGATAIELDVHATSDRHLVVCHDETVDRTTNHRGAISTLSLAQLREMDNAYWWVEGADVTPDAPDVAYRHRGRAPADRDFAIATLEDVVERFPGVLLNLDIKRTAPDVEPYESLLADELRRLERTESVIVASFHDRAIESFRHFAPEVATSAATNETATFYFASRGDSTPRIVGAAALQVPLHFGEVTVVDERFVEAARAADLALHVWTVNEPDEMDYLVDLGVDGIISDRPSVLSALLQRRGVTWDGEIEAAG